MFKSIVRILVCEEDEDAAAMYKTMLESSGHEVHSTLDGQECLDYYNHSKYDVVILDYKLPSVDGLEVARQILSGNQEQKIIFTLDFESVLVANSIKELKDDMQLLMKPFEPQFLVEAVEDKDA